MPRESAVAKKARLAEILTLLQKEYPEARCTLHFETPHQLMVATILSAQCTDERVNELTKTLFKKYRSVRDFAEADLEQLARDVYAAGFHNAKANAIKTSAHQLLEWHHGQIPSTLSELVKLHGVGRKTASVILGAAFGLAEGIVVDTHVARLSRLLKLTSQSDPVRIENDLMALVFPPDWILFPHLLISHGRAVCIARRPRCDACVLCRLCPSART